MPRWTRRGCEGDHREARTFYFDPFELTPAATGLTPFWGGSLKPVVEPFFGTALFAGFVERFA